MKMPYIKFYGRDWLSEQGLRLSSLSARGAWIDMLCWMATGDRHGYMERNGEPYTEDQIAMLIGTDKGTLKGLIEELKKNGVLSYDDRGCIYSRRLVNDMNKHDMAVESGKRGGSPVLNENSKTRTQNPEPTVSLRVPLKDTLKGDVSYSFDRCWKAYPDKSGSKHKALEAYKKANAKEADVMAGIDRYVKFVEFKRNNGFRELNYANGQTWFNQRRWETEYDCPAQVKKDRIGTVNGAVI